MEESNNYIEGEQICTIIQLKAELSANHHTYDGFPPVNGTVNGIAGQNDAHCRSLRSLKPENSAEWEATVETVVKSVVAIHFSRPHPFDGKSPLDSQATGFIVDATRGYILTNQHVVTTGPFYGYCIFSNHEEVRKRTQAVDNIHSKRAPKD